METIGNIEIDAEDWAAKLLSGNYSTVSHVTNAIVSIPKSEKLEVFSDEIKTIEDIFIKKEDHVDVEVCKRYADGKMPETYAFFIDFLRNAQELTSNILIVHEKQRLDRMGEFKDRLEAAENMDQYMMEIDRSYDTDPQDHLLRQTFELLPELIRRLQIIISLYGKGYEDFKLDPISEDIEELQLQIPSFSRMLFKQSLPLEVGIRLGHIVESIAPISQQYPITPITRDVVSNVVKFLKNPDNYYNKVKSGKVIQKLVGQIFVYCYEGHAFYFAKKLMESFPKMTYQQKIEFKKAFGIYSDDSNLINLSTTYINVGYLTLGD